jgi:VanZ family protein
MLKKLTIVYTIIIVLLAVLPINSGDSLLNHNFILSVRLDYLVHFVIFVPWMILVWLTTGVRFTGETHKALGWFMAGIFLAVFTEALQYCLPWRAFNINDLIANLMGILIGAVLFFFRPPVIKALK